MGFVDYGQDNQYMQDPPIPSGKRSPREFFINSVSNNRKGQREHIVKARAYRLIPQRGGWRLYYDYCDHGALNELLYTHAGRNQNGHRIVTGQNATGQNIYKPVKPFPEAYLVSSDLSESRLVVLTFD